MRVYLREMGSVPLLTREGEVNLARKMERGKLRMQKAISRSPLVQSAVTDSLSRSARVSKISMHSSTSANRIEEGSAADIKRRNEVKETFNAYLAAEKKLQQTADKFAAVPANNKKLRKKWAGKVVRAKVELSKALRSIPFLTVRWKEFVRAIEKTRKKCPFSISRSRSSKAGTRKRRRHAFVS